MPMDDESFRRMVQSIQEDVDADILAILEAQAEAEATINRQVGEALQYEPHTVVRVSSPPPPPDRFEKIDATWLDCL